ncbi:unnamed protein product [Brassica napus]|nr:unnamed protein product [Brassica napus]
MRIIWVVYYLDVSKSIEFYVIVSFVNYLKKLHKYIMAWSYVVSSKKAQAIWYGKILEAWKQAKPRPQTDEEAARLVITTLKGHKKADLEGLLSFYRLPSPGKLDEILMNHLCLTDLV